MVPADEVSVGLHAQSEWRDLRLPPQRGPRQLNPKSEARNPKQIQMTQIRITQPTWIQLLFMTGRVHLSVPGFKYLRFRISILEIRISTDPLHPGSEHPLRLLHPW